jgi:hypothetical protein
MRSSYESSSRADSSAKLPSAVPGARIEPGLGMLSRTCWSCVATFGQAYAAPVAMVMGSTFSSSRPLALPVGDCGEQAEWAVGLRGDGEGLVVDHLGGVERGRDIAALYFRPPRIARNWRRGIADAQHRSRLAVLDLDEPHRRGRLLLRLRHHHGDVLAVVEDAVVPQRQWRRGAKRRHRAVSQRRSVLVGDHGQDPWRRLRGCGVDVADRSGCDGGLHQRGVRHARQGDVGRIGRGPGHLGRPVDPIDRLPDELGRDGSGHDRTLRGPPTAC